MDAAVEVSFGNNHTRITHFEYDHRMGVIIYPQDISDFYILKCKLARCVHSGRQTAKCLIAEYKGESYTAYGNNIHAIESAAIPTVIV